MTASSAPTVEKGKKVIFLAGTSCRIRIVRADHPRATLDGQPITAGPVVFLPLDGGSHDLTLTLGPIASTEAAAEIDSSALPIPPD